MVRHRVPMLRSALRTALRRPGDPVHSPNPEVRELVAALATLEVAPPPSADFRAELRAQLVAVTPRLVAEGSANSSADADVPRREAKQAASADAAGRRHRFVKPLIAAACVLTTFVLLLGGAVLISQRALPGDALYGLKRASENVDYSLTTGRLDRGELKLDFASHRISEAADLLPTASAVASGTTVSSGTDTLVRQTLASADSDVRTAAQLLGAAAVNGNSAAPLQAMTNWAPGELAAIGNLLARVPAGSLHDRAAATEALILAAEHRANALKADVGCRCLGSSGTDSLGPIPCHTGCGTPSTGGSTHGTSNKHGGASVPAKSSGTGQNHSGSTHSGGTSLSPGAGGSAGPTSGGAAPTPSGGLGTSPGGGSLFPKPGTSLPSPSLPGLPTSGLPSIPGRSAGQSLPVSVNSCGVNVSLGPIGIGVNGC